MNSVGKQDEFAARLGDRFTVVRRLGLGSSGRTYLVQDRQRDDQLCVIKDTLTASGDPANQSAEATESSAWFEQEAHLLGELSNQQVPKFQTYVAPAKSAESNKTLVGQPLLVQDYIQGPSYQALLQDRQKFGGSFSETEITQLLYQLLPVLSDVHSQGLVHRIISPENIILRQSDGLPVLIGFEKARRIGTGTPSPNEPNPTGDLYGLAATTLVLATGEAPEMLHDDHYGTWRGYESLSPKLGQILRTMLSANLAERFPTADAVLEALQASEAANDVPWNSVNDSVDDSLDGGDPTAFNLLYPMAGGVAAAGMAGAVEAADGGDFEDSQVMAVTTPEVMPSEPMGYVDSAANESGVYDRELLPNRTNTEKPKVNEALIGLLLTLGLAMTALMLYVLSRGNESQTALRSDGQQLGSTQVTQVRDGEYFPEENSRKALIQRRRDGLNISESYFTELVNQLFYQEYPTLLTAGADGGRKELTTAAADEPLRIRWDNIATRVLDTMESSFNNGSQTDLGNYNENSRSRWRSLISAQNVGDRSLNDLVDARFFSLFPSQAGRDFLATPVGQLYYAIAEDRAQAISTGSVTETVSFGEGSLSRDVSGKLSPGDGRIYLMTLSAGQLLRLNLTAPSESTQLSLYMPEPTDDNPAVFADSEQTTWSGGLTQSGLYEVVVVNRMNEAIDYQLSLAVDNVTSAPIAPPREEEREAENKNTTEETPLPDDNNQPDSSETDSSEDATSETESDQ